MKATDLDLEITEATAAKVERAGATTVPAHLLYDIVRKLPEGAEVMLRTDEDGNSMSVDLGPLELPPAVPAAVGFPGAHGRLLLAYLPARIRRR